MNLLSICIPTFNRAPLLRKTLEAIIRETDGSAVEVVVSDNASIDGTESMMKDFTDRYPFIRYFRNADNIGLDRNTLVCLEKASGEYCWLCSDDDIVLPGAFARIRTGLDLHNPPLLYLNFAGFLDSEDYTVVLARASDSSDHLYESGELMMRDHLLNHFSAMVWKRSLALQYAHLVERYANEWFDRGYVLVIAHHIVLRNKGPFVYLGKLCLAVRNPVSNNYNPLTTLIDTARHYQFLRADSLISEETEQHVLNWFIRGFYRLVLPMRCYHPKDFTDKLRDDIIRTCKGYSTFYPYLYPALVLPRWMLIAPYWMGRRLKGMLRKMFRSSPFS